MSVRHKLKKQLGRRRGDAEEITENMGGMIQKWFFRLWKLEILPFLVMMSNKSKYKHFKNTSAFNLNGNWYK